MPIRRRALRRSRRFSARMSTPSSRTLPEVGSTRRLMQRMSVLLPAPEGPMMVTTSGSPTEKLTRFSAAVPVGYVLDSSVIFSMGAGARREAPPPPGVAAGSGVTGRRGRGRGHHLIFRSASSV